MMSFLSLNSHFDKDEACRSESRSATVNEGLLYFHLHKSWKKHKKTLSWKVMKISGAGNITFKGLFGVLSQLVQISLADDSSLKAVIS